MTRTLRLRMAAAVFGTFLSGAGAALAGPLGPPALAAPPAALRTADLPGAAVPGLPGSREEVRLEGYGVQVAAPARLFPRLRPARAGSPFTLLMRHGDLLDRLVSAPVLRFGTGPGAAGLDALPGGLLPDPLLEDGADSARVALLTDRHGRGFPLSPVPEPGTGLLLAWGLLLLGLASRQRIGEPATSFPAP